MILSRVNRQGSITGFWNAIPAIDTGPSTASPATVTLPLVGKFKPVASFISEDFPQPDGPTTATKAPFSTVRFNPSTASVPSSSPCGLYRRETSSISTKDMGYSTARSSAAGKNDGSKMSAAAGFASNS